MVLGILNNQIEVPMLDSLDPTSAMQVQLIYDACKKGDQEGAFKLFVDGGFGSADESGRALFDEMFSLIKPKQIGKDRT